MSARPLASDARADARLVLSEAELDAALELQLLAEASLQAVAEAALEGAEPRLGRGHWRLAFLLKRRPGLGVGELAQLTGLSKQGASKALGELEAAGLAAKALGEDGRRRPAELTGAGRIWERAVGERMRAALARAYRTGGLEHADGARRIWAALAGARAAPAREVLS